MVRACTTHTQRVDILGQKAKLKAVSPSEQKKNSPSLLSFQRAVLLVPLASESEPHPFLSALIYCNRWRMGLLRWASFLPLGQAHLLLSSH